MRHLLFKIIPFCIAARQGRQERFLPWAFTSWQRNKGGGGGEEGIDRASTNENSFSLIRMSKRQVGGRSRLFHSFA